MEKTFDPKKVYKDEPNPTKSIMADKEFAKKCPG